LEERVKGITPYRIVHRRLSAVDNAYIFEFKLKKAMEFALIAFQG
jgi:hypothetical protein